MTYEEFEFGQFVAKVRSRAEDVIGSEMTVAEMDESLRRLAVSIIEDLGGASALLHVYPPMTAITVDLKDFRYSPPSASALLAEIAVQSMLEVMEPVRKATIIAFFEDGMPAGVQRLFDFVINAHPHARGVISSDNADILGLRLVEIATGEISEHDLAAAIVTCERALRLLSIPVGGRVTDNLGGRETILAQKDVAEKLLAARTGNIDGFYRDFLDELAGRDKVQVPLR
jgi:hypothetical protein